MLHIKTFAFNPFSENTYIIYNDDKEAFIIDPGNFQIHETQQIESFLDDNQLKVKNILLTHAHIDHVLGLQWAYDKYDVPVLLHLNDKELLDRAPMSAMQFGFAFTPFVGNLEFLNDGDVIKLGDEEFKILFVPGHSPGSIAFYNEKEAFVISGDVLFYGSIGRTDLYKASYEQLIESIKTKLLVLNPDTKVYSGHGDPTTIGFEKDFNPFLK
ncbi:Glyoxylase, beta-lactamase superfamily II [Soonwooa buanensis]|uniref:Glyoxylase, beta-lactamase superfamily II n=1 Tax=Soonwooa buanensis TaxID=619805 RepID=A0A1T5G1A9_9FLAO|nr:MBL fold metallo-hydrolase [Soonwooa buanensis]SKC02054.1 Glyoxylase, beta-lactamase superfamily II [Soonwooa buanensis]